MKKLVLCLASLMMISTCATGCQNKEANKDEENKSENESGVKVDESIVSWANMKIDNPDLKLTEDQIEVLKYFDVDYFYVNDYNNLQRYPKVYDNSQIAFPCHVIKTMNADENEYELLVSMIGKDDELMIIKGKQQEPRIIEGDYIVVYGRYQGVKQYEIDGKSVTKPTITVNKTTPFYLATNSAGPRYEYETINIVAKAIFGTDIKVKEEVADTDYKLGAMYSPQEKYFLVTPDDQSNANFKEFELTATNPAIRTPNPTAETSKSFNVSADFNHYIVSTHEQTTNTLYLEYYDRDFKKVWGNEYSNVDTVPYDYTTDSIYLVADNDLHIIDTKTGKDKQEPIMVGEKIKVVMVEDGAILVGTGNKDNVMKVDSTGKTIWKASADIEVTNCSMLQIIDGNVVVSLANYQTDGSEFNMITSGTSKIIAIDKDGKITQEFEDWKYGV